MSTPTYDAFLASLEDMTFLKTAIVSLNTMTDRFGDDHGQLAEDVLKIADSLGWDSRAVFAAYIFDYLKEQRLFEKKGNYGHLDFDKIREEILENAHTMNEVYLPGLFLSYPMTPVLFHKYDYFRRNFLPQLSSDMVGTEVGYGDGFYLWVLLRSVPGLRMTGYDISPHAKGFAETLLSAAGIEAHRHDLGIANVIEGLPVEPGSLDFALLAEMIEHIPNPVDAIVEVGDKLKPGGLLYVATMIDCNHMDHISNFESPKVVEDLITDSGFRIESGMSYRVTDDLPDSRDPTVSIAYIARKD